MNVWCVLVFKWINELHTGVQWTFRVYSGVHEWLLTLACVFGCLRVSRRKVYTRRHHRNILSADVSGWPFTNPVVSLWQQLLGDTSGSTEQVTGVFHVKHTGEVHNKACWALPIFVPKSLCFIALAQTSFLCSWLISHLLPLEDIPMPWCYHHHASGEATIRQVMRDGWLPPDVTLDIQDEEFSLGFTRPENPFHGQESFTCLMANSKRAVMCLLLSKVFSIKTWLVDCYRDGGASGRFPHLPSTSSMTNDRDLSGLPDLHYCIFCTQTTLTLCVIVCSYMRQNQYNPLWNKAVTWNCGGWVVCVCVWVNTFQMHPIYMFSWAITEMFHCGTNNDLYSFFPSAASPRSEDSLVRHNRAPYCPKWAPGTTGLW